jgi:Zn-dependent alcohol dehydrogenase
MRLIQAGDIVAEKKRSPALAPMSSLMLRNLLPEAVNLVTRGRPALWMNQHANRPVNQYTVTRHEISILGSFIQRTSFPKVVKILEAGLLPVEKLVTHRLTLSEVHTGLEAMKQGQAIKVAVAP